MGANFSKKYECDKQPFNTNGNAKIYFCQERDGDKRQGAVKILDKKTASMQEIDEFKRELKLHSQCKHKNVVELLDTFEDKDKIWMVMERAQSDLLTYLEKSPPKDEGQVLRMSLQIIDGVVYLHSMNIYHRDIKLDNILVFYQ